MDTPVDMWSLIDKAGTIGCFVLFTVGIMTGRIVAGHHYQRSLKEIEEWKSVAMRGHSINRQAVETVETLIGKHQ